MKKIIILLCFTLLSLSSYAKNNFAAGVAIGFPTGMTYSYDLGNNQSVEGILGWTLSDFKGSFDAHLVKKEEDKYMLQAYDLDFKLGYGVKAVTAKKFKIGPSVLTGVEHPIDNTQFTILLNATAAVLFGDESLGGDLGTYFGARYLF